VTAILPHQDAQEEVIPLIFLILYGKNDFAERSKILIGYRSEKKRILFNYQNSYVER